MFMNNAYTLDRCKESIHVSDCRARGSNNMTACLLVPWYCEWISLPPTTLGSAWCQMGVSFTEFSEQVIFCYSSAVWCN